ncbi:MAG: threonine synthase [Bacillota bacterium]
MQYISTRNNGEKVSFSRAVVNGLASGGGLYVPETIPTISKEELEGMYEETYVERAVKVLSKFMTDFSKEEIEGICEKAYSKFYGDVAPVVKISDELFIMELFHGPTMAFKDVALTFLPYALTTAMKKCEVKEEVVILVATSGDTGKAALEGFKNVDGTKIIVFYPSEGVSDVQKLQMTSQEGSNVCVVGVDGNFDNCQTGVKNIFGDEAFVAECLKNGSILSSANSINFGRLLPQIVYYFSSYADLVQSGEIKAGDKIHFSVPTGNFGDILAGYYAKQMGLPVDMLICASNENNVLTDFFKTGEYDLSREFFKTMSPSMDILISSNLERLLYEISGRDDKLTVARMESLKKTGKYSITDEEFKILEASFYGDYCSEEETAEMIADFFEECDYPLDPHTAVGVFVSDLYRGETEDETPVVSLSTASPYKFLEDVMKCLGVKTSADIFKNAKEFHELSGVELPVPFENLRGATARFKEVIKKDKMKASVKGFVSK